MGLDLSRDLEYKMIFRYSDVETGFAGVAEGWMVL